ncbi:hypothetical protein IM792_03835 [Mucilaginibacter sp. JRF]|uniref:hypothetical protein n=1 Tax=Mucilaginibacter sp. JRF TaxID=2780088 RepID=UPI001880619E|nr:hypothetical protein [Mucilaginibacter sp. JRF]MBE9583569.1 hypothetical protein [Mucilaginibacter sp. JRF]
MTNNAHYGQLLEYAVRRKGISLTELAVSLKVNRRTIYNWFESPYLKNNIIYRIGLAINHDFSVEFPQYFTSDMFSSDKVRSANEISTYADSSDWKDKYINLLEKYNQVLTTMSARV